jgi:hypothetical protein
MTKRRTVRAEARAIKKASMRRGRNPDYQMSPEYEKERDEILIRYATGRDNVIDERSEG